MSDFNPHPFDPPDDDPPRTRVHPRQSVPMPDPLPPDTPNAERAACVCCGVETRAWRGPGVCPACGPRQLAEKLAELRAELDKETHRVTGLCYRNKALIRQSERHRKFIEQAAIDIGNMRAELTAAEAERDALRTALEPFAIWASFWNDTGPGVIIIGELTVADFRRAASALSSAATMQRDRLVNCPHCKQFFKVSSQPPDVSAPDAGGAMRANNDSKFVNFVGPEGETK